MNRMQRRFTLMGLTAAVWTGVISVGLQKQQLLARGPATLTIETDPKSVRILVDGEKFESGSYVTTPTELPMRPGRHKISIMRDGYMPAERTVDLITGETENLDDVVLARRPGMSFATVEISSAELPVTCEVDEGFGRGPTPLTVVELVAGQTHTVTCFPKWPNRETAVRCKFTPATGDDDSPAVKLRLWSKQGKFKISGCDKRPAP